MPLSIDFLLKANSPRNWSPEISRPAPQNVPSGPRTPEILVNPKRRSLRAQLRRVARRFYPLVSPFAWRTRTFLLKPQFDIETRLAARIDASEARLASRLGEVTELVRTTEKAATDSLSEQRRLFVSLRNLIETQSIEIARLERQVADSAARMRTDA
ncbi:hypothetical protein E3T40_01780 [Cryobacterium sp. TMT1-19]|uniref:hypothetical protein n=1 Tax=Cryobacterium sp. TMT1-19 TaxID=1259231 RepID=UPI00106C29DE|nr:hypothetical protein [Cryobacterium sp. TMT1-19]TFD39226.1 hypothetical protein E3T40_01780 [Cryobacterium sp. TMT1-19]